LVPACLSAGSGNCEVGFEEVRVTRTSFFLNQVQHRRLRFVAGTAPNWYKTKISARAARLNV
jgi:hypothetical protein